MITVDLDTKVKLIHGFSNKTRLQILESIKMDEKTVSEIVADIGASQSSISQHLACLKECGIIIGRQQGKYIYYALRNQNMRDLLSMFDTVLDDVGENVASCENHIDGCGV
ncbi:ArsR/SmtB family transcription factor [Salinicoccus hispanicus]|uniref:Metalloregulator ArsR/SmtB family transcription factor n=1 Tax=Salinicoccus hispanicus TaxID=157225 RepID=A0A6N8TWN5_9STAP|nr:metalloregulator ArsR/SmtB family transcription factor [Salinicoccus hispanicus]MXQ50110.1 metalloregulator ArsR/SmtB family transcription factor [Salinicoccus hispanicus]